MVKRSMSHYICVLRANVIVDLVQLKGAENGKPEFRDKAAVSSGVLV